MAIRYGGFELIPSLEPGDTLYLRGGTYTTHHPTIPSGVSWDEPVTISVYPDEQVTWIPTGVDARVVDLQDTSYVILENLLLDGRWTYDCVRIGSTDFNSTLHTITGSSHHNRLRRCELCFSPGQGLQIEPGCDYNEIVRCSIHHNGTNNYNHGVYCESWYNLIEGCRVFDNKGHGLHISNGYGWCTGGGNVIRGNRCHHNGIGGVGYNGAGIGLYYGTDNEVLGNWVWHNCTGIKLDYGETDAILHNNRAWGCTSDPANNLMIDDATVAARSGNIIQVD